MTTPRLLIAAALLALSATALAQPCTPHFVTGYNTAASLSGTVTAATTFRGQLLASGNLQVGGITTRFARFNGQSWEAVPNLTVNGDVNTLVSRTENGNEVLYIGGTFSTVNAQPSIGIVRWDGSTVTHFPGLFSQSGGVAAIEFFDSGAGPEMHIAMRSLVAKWNGAAWTSIGVTTGNSNIRALHTFNDGSGTKLYAAGYFTSIAGQPIHSIAAWDGATWHAANAGLLPQEGFPTDIYTLTVHNDGAGPRLHAAGCINTIARNFGDTAVARLEGGTWVSLLAEDQTSNARSASKLLSTVENGAPVLYAAMGSLVEDPTRIRRFSGGVWTNVGQPIATSVDLSTDEISELLIAPINGQNTLLALGTVANGALRWTGTTWSTIESWNSLPPPPAGARIYADPAATDGVYYIDGAPRKGNTYLDSTAPVPPSRGLARFSRDSQSLLVFASETQTALHDGTAWITLPAVPGNIQTLRASRDTIGQGDTAFLVTATDAAAQVYRLDGLQWSPVGPPIEANTSSFFRAVQTYSSGAGPEVYVGGRMGPANARRLVRLAGDQWLDVPGVDGTVYDLTIFDVGDGPELIMAGDFLATTGQTSGGVSRWNGARIAPIGSGISAPARGSAFAVFNDGSGPRLFIGVASASPPLRYWNGSTWASLGAFSPGSSISGLAPIIDEDGNPSLMITGTFTAAGGIPATNLAQYTACRATCTADFNGDGDTGTDQDIEAFFACIGGTCCPTCGSPDFNHDGDTGTDQDIESFFRVLGGGTC
ncbi:MAG TPA: hypothetical protein VD997_10035 [Phycisphaerales bacterium]|nr:hypothetical protein [Phycisphaerales bacterium]